jgi:hypothetical protein
MVRPSLANSAKKASTFSKFSPDPMANMENYQPGG